MDLEAVEKEKEKAKEEYHHKFVFRTDRKSLYTQIKDLVGKAQKIAQEELQHRRESLQKLLEHEDHIYEEEFASKVKSRIDKDIKKRMDVLLKIKEERDRVSLEFLESKRIQQYMNSCYEIREALRRKDTMEIKECQLEQMLEKERAIARNRELNQCWNDVQQRSLAKFDKRQAEENCLKCTLARQNTQVLDLQLEEKQCRNEELNQVKKQEFEDTRKLMEDLRLEEFESQLRGVPLHMHAYRRELMEQWQADKAKKVEEARKLADEHRQLMCEIKVEELAAREEMERRKRAAHKSMMEYIEYVKKMRVLQEGRQKIAEERIDDLRRVDICTKSNIKREIERKAEIAALCHAELVRQICEQRERHMREEMERREVKMIENRFVHVEITREQILEQRRINRRELDKQIAQMNIERQKEEQKCRDELKAAIVNPELCDQLAIQYIDQGVDYLDPHPNWRMLTCPEKKVKPPMPHSYSDRPPEGVFTEKSVVEKYVVGKENAQRRDCYERDISKYTC